MRHILWVFLVLIGLVAVTACSESNAPESKNLKIDITTPAEKETVLIKTYWDGNQTLVKEEFYAVQGAEHIKHGPYKFYTESQTLSMEYNYVDGSMQGKILEYYESGMYTLPGKL